MESVETIDLDDIRKRNDQSKAGIGHHGECEGQTTSGFFGDNCNCGVSETAEDIDVLVAEVERLRRIIGITTEAELERAISQASTLTEVMALESRLRWIRSTGPSESKS